MAGIVAQYNQVPRIRNIITPFIIEPVGGNNPADLGQITVTNVRGQLSFDIISGDNQHQASFEVVGGFGDYPQDSTQNFFFSTGTNINCTVNALQVNRLEILTPVADAGGRRYILEFKPVQSIGPTIQQTSVNTIGNFTLTVRIKKQVFVQGF